MDINSTLALTKKSNGSLIIEAVINGSRQTNVITFDRTTPAGEFYNRALGAKDRNALYTDFFNKYGDFLNIGSTSTEKTVEAEPLPPKTPEESLLDGLKGLMKFFTEFDFEPNFRFVNTLSMKLTSSEEDAKNFIKNYFALMDNSYASELSAKMRSPEFKKILEDIAKGGAPKTQVNNRFKVYYGSAGTGKTTLAQTETNNRCVVCNASMLPSDIMEDFVFVNGQPSFKPSIVWECMEQGLPIVLDEINLLPFDSLRFLQGVLDGKKEFDYKGHKVHIADGFAIIGTMNLSIGGMIYGLPEPLVDRANDIRKFTLTAEQLAKSIL